MDKPSRWDSFADRVKWLQDNRGHSLSEAKAQVRREDFEWAICDAEDVSDLRRVLSDMLFYIDLRVTHG